MRTFKGKNAVWFYFTFILYNVIPFASWPWDLGLLIILVIYYLIGDLIFIPCMINNKIELYDDYFIFHYMFSKQKVMLKDIKTIKKSHSFIASSANSLDRIYIETKNQSMYISLKENDEFIRLVNEKREHIL
ncbi:PH domain-containing protein [Traorella massiliensis]|uniref:PH domain-containing protein n=1 Tax=Traorella massiliensis TaxID=1903263 RepID=UPI0008F8BD24|nr:PH domain-containing protein [Traorella massiliensis]